MTSYTHPYPKTGGIESQVVFCYSHVGLPVAEYQSHDGPVDMLATPQVQYAYDDTLDAGELVKGLRPTRVTYPNGRIVRYEYGESGSSSSSSGLGASDPDDLLNRIKFIADDDEGAVGTHLAEYTRLGLSTIVRVDYTEPQIRYDLAHGAGSDPCAGLDRFGRVIDLLWRNYGTGEDVVRIRHGYDRAGNRLYREDPVAAAHGVDLDEVYTYDGLYQLKTFVRGAINAQKTAIAAPTFRQAWDFDSTGNWTRFREDKDGDGRWDLDQTRQHNAANELTSFESKIGDLWISPLHDRNGNMIRIPQPKDPTKQFTLRYDAWNRLVKVSDPAGPVADYHYDARNFRVVKEVHRDPADPIPGEESYARYPETRHFYYNSSWQCLEERASSSPAVPPHSLPADRQFVWGLRYIDDLLLRDRATQPSGNVGVPNSCLDERLYAMQDPHWSMVGIAQSAGVIAARWSYAAYGERTFIVPTSCSRGASTYAWEALYTGRSCDPETGLYDYRARPYLAGSARFIRRDPLNDLTRDANLYRYCSNAPTRAVDPSGLEPLSDITDAPHVRAPLDIPDCCCPPVRLEDLRNAPLVPIPPAPDCVTKNYASDTWSSRSTGRFGSYVLGLSYTITQSSGKYRLCKHTRANGNKCTSVTFEYKAHVDVTGSLGVSWEWNGLLGIGVMNAGVTGEVFVRGQGDLNAAGCVAYWPPAEVTGTVKVCGSAFSLSAGARVTGWVQVPGYELSAAIAGSVTYQARFCATLE